MKQFLEGVDARKGRWRGVETSIEDFEPRMYWTGRGREALEVAYATSSLRPPVTEARRIWHARHGRAAAPLMLVVAFPEGGGSRALVCGPSGESPPVVELDLAQAERLAAAALDETNRHLASRLLSAALERASDEVPGLRNRGLLATHELTNGVPMRADWVDAVEKGGSVLHHRDHELMRALGFQLESAGKHHVLRTGHGNSRAVAVFLQEEEQPDVPGFRYDMQTPVTYALTQADRENLPWVVSVRGRSLRLYSTATSGAVGQRGRTETYVELDLALLPSDLAGYVHLLFSSDALARGGTLQDIQRASMDFTAGLSERLRDRVYEQVVPRLALAVARRSGRTDEEALDHHYQTVLTIVFRLLFVSYAEDSGLLPLHVNGEYTDNALKSTARRLAEGVNAGRDLGFDDPLTGRTSSAPDRRHDDLWRACQQLFEAVDQGHRRWGVPAYNGGLFAASPDVNPVGAEIASLDLSNEEFGPALTALIVDRTPDGSVGPIDFRSLSVREFGTIYEGLLESELSRADQDLRLDEEGLYVPVREGDPGAVPAGEVYLHDASGKRKASGSYFTKPFAVNHLLDRALEPTLTAHLDRVAHVLDEGREADAADLLFDFRVADVSMGSGHFLTAVVDRLEARFARFLAERPIRHVASELERLRRQAHEALGDEAGNVEIETASLLRRLVARRCVYGVDVNPISVELARVSIWIHTFVPGLPLSFLNDSLVVGDSLTGVATIQEAIEELEVTQGPLYGELLTTALSRAEEPLAKLGSLIDATPEDVVEARRAAAEVREAVEPVAAFFDLVTSKRAGGEAPPVVNGADDLEAMVDDPAREVATELQSLHFPVAFPEVFLREPSGFDVIVGNPPWDKLHVERHEFWARNFPGLRALPRRDRDDLMKEYEASRPDLAASLQAERERARQMNDVLAGGPYSLGKGHKDLSKAFAWRMWHLIRHWGRMGVVLPRQAVLASPGMKHWRDEILRQGAFEDVCLVQNAAYWAFDDMEARYTIGLVTARRGGTQAGLRLHGPYRSLEDYHTGVEREPHAIGAEEFRSWGETLTFPTLNDRSDIDIYRAMLRHPGIGGARGDFTFRPIQGDINAAADRFLFVDASGYPRAVTPVFSGASFNLWTPETGEVYAWADADTVRQHLFEKRKRQARYKRSAFHGLPKEVLEDPTTLPLEGPRIAFRDIARATDQRTLIVALVPPHVVLQHKAPYLVPVRAEPQDEAYVLAFLSSRVLDWMPRRMVETNMTFTIFDSLPVPARKPEHHGVQRVVELGGRLAAVDERYADWAAAVGVDHGPLPADEAEEMKVELDACVARLYGLEERQIRILYATFHPTWDHGPWTERVLAHYRTLTWEPAEVPA